MSTEKIEKLKNKKLQIDARIKKLSARDREKKRKQDTRRKIIAGALALNHFEKNPNDAFSQKMRRLLNEYVTKPNERALFGLDPLPDVPKRIPANDKEIPDGTLRKEFSV